MWILLAGIAALAVWAYQSWPHGTDPFDALPSDIGAKTGANDVKATSGRMYTVTSYAPNAQDRTFHVAVQKDLPNWIRYYQDRKTGVRAFDKAYAGGSTDNATDEQILAGLRKDFVAT